MDSEHIARHLARCQVGFVQRSAGDEKIGILGAGAPLHRRLHTVTGNAAQVEPLLQRAQQLGIGVDHRDVVLLGRQTLGHTLADPSGAQDDHAHGITFKLAA